MTATSLNCGPSLHNITLNNVKPSGFHSKQTGENVLGTSAVWLLRLRLVPCYVTKSSTRCYLSKMFWLTRIGQWSALRRGDLLLLHHMRVTCAKRQISF